MASSLVPSFFGSRRTNVFDPFSLDIWDPFDGFFTSTVANVQSSAKENNSDFSNARIDWKETPEAHIFKADRHSGAKERGGRRRKNDKWHRIERRSSGKFLRRFRLPENAKVDQIKAGMENCD
ncbi:18.1 kDa class I heat shock protein [Manihot esculenta]|uniref:SHSP domain-containing protein n=1 Tax=Manihot esculenta TaxID=3983 RepID=A0A2C9W2H7_MANES|nr:18.1 kDa class I heat shock protein [Manihot esculenta]